MFLETIRTRLPLIASLLATAADSASQIEERIRYRLPHLYPTSGVTFTPAAFPSPVPSSIEHSVLRSDATPADVHQVCHEAWRLQFKAVCVTGCHVKEARKVLDQELEKHKAAADNSAAPSLACVVGYPLGTSSTAAKAFEAKDAVENGANEVNVVMNTGALKADHYQATFDDLVEVVRAAKHANRATIVKVIIESNSLPVKEKIIDACIIAALAGADMVETATGFNHTSPVTAEQVRLMKATVGNSLKVSATGGVKDRNIAEAMLEAGAERLGTSHGVEIVGGTHKESDKY